MSLNHKLSSFDGGAITEPVSHGKGGIHVPWEDDNTHADTTITIRIAMDVGDKKVSEDGGTLSGSFDAPKVFDEEICKFQPSQWKQRFLPEDLSIQKSSNRQIAHTAVFHLSLPA